MKNKYNLFAVLLICLLTSAAFSQTSKTTLSFTILDENDNYLPDLQLSDFRILEGRKSLQVNTIESKIDNNLEVVIMIDASASQERTVTVEKKAAEYIIDNILKKENDKIAVVKFSGNISVEQDFTNDFSTAKEKVRKIEFEPPAGYIGGGTVVSRDPPTKNSGLFTKGATSIWDSVKKIMETISKSKSDNSRQVIILISDGVNTFGESKLKEAIMSSIKNNVPIYAVGIGDDFYGGVDKKTLEKLTEQTGGIAVLPKEKLEDLPMLMKKIEQSLRSNYQANVTVDNSDSKNFLRETRIEIINPALRKRKLQVIQSKGYFLP